MASRTAVKESSQHADKRGRIANRVTETHFEAFWTPLQNELPMLGTLPGKDMQPSVQSGIVAREQVAELIAYDPGVLQIEV